MTGLLPWLRKHPLIAYFILAYAISWAIWLPLAAQTQGWVSGSIPYALYYFGSLGPLLASLVMTAATGGRSGLRDLVRRVVKWRVELRYYLLVVIAPVVLFLVGALLSFATSHQWPDLSLLGQADYLPYLTPLGTLALWILTYGLGEEMGWRGFALPHLQRDRSAASATLVLALLWAGWHLPLFFFRDTYMSMGPMGFLLFAFLMLFTTMVFTWLYNGTGGSLLLTILFHAIFNWLTASDAGGPFAQALLSAPVVLWALWVGRRYGQENAAPLAKQTA